MSNIGSSEVYTDDMEHVFNITNPEEDGKQLCEICYCDCHVSEVGETLENEVHGIWRDTGMLTCDETRSDSMLKNWSRLRI